MAIPTPFVYWAQSDTQLFLKVDLRDAENPHIFFEDRRVKFECKGVGALGTQKYSFALDFYSEINADASRCKVLPGKIDIEVIKAKKSWWPRLTSVQKKPVWLKIDFDKWQSEEDLNSEEENEKLRDIREDYNDLYKRLQQEEIGYTKDVLKVYMIIYNLLMFVGFLYVGSVMTVKYLKDGVYCYRDVYDSVGIIIQYLHVLQFSEVILALYGLTSSGVMAPFIQVGGRLFVIFCLIVPEERLHDQPVVFCLYYAYCIIEIIRYPFYVTQVVKVDYYILTWLRYSLWIILYPIGLSSEAVITYKSILYLDETKRFSVSMPNWYNFSFSLATVLRIYLLIFFLPTAYFLILHMYRGRQKRLNSKKWIEKN